MAWLLVVVATPELLGVAIGRDERPGRSRGAPPKNAAPAHYDQLMKQGRVKSEACRIVGISRSSGTRWRHGHSVVLKSGDIKRVAPISHQRPVVISARFLSESERITIADLLYAGRRIRAFAAEVGRSPSAVNREIRGISTNRLATTARGRPSALPNVDGAVSGPGRSSPTRSCGNSCANT